MLEVHVVLLFHCFNASVSVVFCRKYKRLFDIAYFSNSMVHHLQPAISETFSDDTMLVLETAKFVTEISNEQYVQFANKICDIAKSVGCQPMIDCDPEKDCFSFHKFHRG